MTQMMEQMLRDPNMQKMLYPYLPEPMRNPDSIEWMLNTPEVRKQLEQTLANSVSGSVCCLGLICVACICGTITETILSLTCVHPPLTPQPQTPQPHPRA